MRRATTSALAFATALALCACGTKSPPPAPPVERDYTYRVVNTYPHDKSAFTQGLLYLDGVLYEGTGREGQSSIRKVKLETGEVLQKRDLPAPYFGEGIAVFQNRLLELTWQAEKGFIYDLATFEPKGEFSYNGEGWGLTSDSLRLIMSDGSDRLRFLDPNSLQETGRLLVESEIGKLSKLNELEFIKGEIWANIWKEDRIVRINPATGKVTGWVDMRGILPQAERPDADDVLNGIAYDAQRDRIFVTGKHWPKLFEIQLVERK
ncbi:MAG TPA: glutaminyl-peptide cyclotransferase [Candidatus Solibacter sp.]|nr:glutaminyl-peptide cyclotransferase [Candidatus Solibacter sp.]